MSGQNRKVHPADRVLQDLMAEFLAAAGGMTGVAVEEQAPGIGQRDVSRWRKAARRGKPVTRMSEPKQQAMRAFIEQRRQREETDFQKGIRVAAARAEALVRELRAMLPAEDV